MVEVENELTQGIADLLQAAGVGTQGGSTGTVIVDGELNPDPDRGIAINVSVSFDDAWHATGGRRCQLYLRGTKDPRVVRSIAQQCFDVLHGIHGVRMGAVVVAHMWRTSAVSLGRDGNDRWERSDNYFVDVELPPTENQSE